MLAILTSALGGQIKVNGKRMPCALPNDNGLLDKLRSVWKTDSKVMLISGSPEDNEKNDSTFFCLKEALPMSRLMVSEFLMCDVRNSEIAERVPEMDVIILAGGHVLTQNAFLKEIRLKEKLESFAGFVIAWSAGSMNCAETVYAGPELPGEATDPSYQRWISGLGITRTNIFPHFEELRDDMLDGMRLIEDITFEDSFTHEIIALNNGSYIVVDGGKETVYGEAYIIKDGKISQICKRDGSVELED